MNYKLFTLKNVFNSKIINPAYFILVIYLLVYIRQYLWFSNLFFFVWIIPFLISTILTLIIIKKLNYSKISIEFILIVGLPILFFYILRFAFPDASWDIINYHYINGERGLQGYPFRKGDFPYLSLANSSTDMITGIYRKILGHRLGTIVNLLVIFWSAMILEKIISKFINNKRIKYILILILLCFEGITYQISNYWIELLSIPLVLQLIYFLIFKKKKDYFDYSIISLFSGILLSFKLVNLCVIIPFSILFLIQYINDLKGRLPDKLIKLFPLIIIFLIPLIPYNFYMYLLTGNPVYPHLNWIFKSDLFHLHNILRRPLGPKDDFEAFIWPFVMLMDSGRLSNTPVYPILTFVGYVFSWSILILNIFIKFKVFKQTKFLFIFFAISVFLWGYLSGDYRFVYFFEILGGLIIIIVLKELIIKINNQDSIFKKFFNIKVLFLSLLFLCIIKFSITLDKALKYEWAERPTLFSNFKEYKRNLKFVLNDYSLKKSIKEEDIKIIDSAKAWISSSPVVSGYMALINNKIPYVDLHHLPYRGKGGEEFFKKIINYNGPIIYTSIIREGILDYDLEKSINELSNYGFKPLLVKKVSLPFYSDTNLNIKELTVLEVFHEDHISNISSNLSEKEFNKKKSTLVIPKWISGCSGLENNNSSTWRWCEKEFSLVFKNITDIPISVDFSFNINSVSKEYSYFNIIKKKNNYYKINNMPKIISEKISIFPGEKYIVKFRSNAPKLEGTTDPRNLHLMITDFNYKTNYIGN